MLVEASQIKKDNPGKLLLCFQVKEKTWSEPDSNTATLHINNSGWTVKENNELENK